MECRLTEDSEISCIVAFAAPMSGEGDLAFDCRESYSKDSKCRQALDEAANEAVRGDDARCPVYSRRSDRGGISGATARAKSELCTVRL